MGRCRLKVDILFVAWNRKAFTVESFQTMLANTEWEHVEKLLIYDDGSTDGTREWLKAQTAPVPIQFKETEYRDPVSVFSDGVRCASAPLVAKIDNDVILPPRWLSDCLSLFEKYPSLSILGIEALCHRAQDVAERSLEPAALIDGIGIFRRDLFDTYPMPEGPSGERDGNYKGIKYWGLARWELQRQLLKGRILPPLPICLLNLLPFEPWQSLSAEYVKQGWQRAWPPQYDASRSELWAWKYGH
jgi:glycosyltransferase involved in cell wall biosynthesis